MVKHKWTFIVVAFLFLFTHSLYGQERGAFITGVVKSPKGEIIRGVVCKYLSERDSLIAYAITDNNGAFSFPRNGKASKISCSHVGYQTEIQMISINRTHYDITLFTKSNNLKEVIVTVAPIERKKDTLNYNVSAFQKKEDVYIEDVLKRMPGIEVAASGEITYQGKSINKLNIEGLDLMGDKYNQATKSMPAEAVSQIQVMENNQPIRALDGAIKNNHATLNIKLKKGYKLKPFGEAEGGWGDKVWAANATAIRVTPKNQWLITGTMDNRGISLTTLTKEMANADRMYTTEPLPTAILKKNGYNVPPLSPIYYLNNKSYFVGINHLHSFSQYFTIRMNLLYNHERSNQKDSVYNMYMAIDTVSTYRQEHLQDYADVVKTQIRYELNAPHTYIENILTGEISWNKTINRYNTNIGNVEENTYQHPLYVQNVFNANIKNGNQIYNLSSIARLFSSKEKMYGLYKTDNEEERQNTHTSNFFMRTRIGTSFHLASNNLGAAYIMEHKNTNIQVVDSAQNNSSHYWLNTLELSYTINMNGGEVELKFPIEHLYQSMMGQVQNKILIAPSVDINYDISPMLSSQVTIGYNQDAGTYDLLYKGVLLNNFNTYSVGMDSMSLSNTFTTNARLSYLNTLKLLSMDFFIGWTKQQKNYLQSFLYTNAFTLSSPIWVNNHFNYLSCAYSIKKNFRNSGFSLKYTTQYVAASQLVRQNGAVGKITTHVLSNTLRAGWDKLSWIHVTAAMGMNMRWKEIDVFSSTHNMLKDFEHIVKVDLFPIKNIHVYTDFSQVFHQMMSAGYAKSCFFNSGVKYIFRKNISMKFSVTNLFNIQSYKESAFNGSNYQFYEIPLRGREILLSLNLRF